jgi:hypothetical protein
MISVTVVLGLVIAFCFGTSDYLSKGLTGQVGFYRTTIYTVATSVPWSLCLFSSSACRDHPPILMTLSLP